MCADSCMARYRTATTKTKGTRMSKKTKTTKTETTAKATVKEEKKSLSLLSPDTPTFASKARFGISHGGMKVLINTPSP